jgi:uncharacterized protein (UPF0261 family)
MPQVLLIGTLDTKGQELAFVRDIFRGAGLETVLVDAGSLGPPTIVPDVSREKVFSAAGTTLGEVSSRADRGFAVAKAAEGVAVLAVASRYDGIFALGGSAGTTIGTSAMRAAPFGTPKVMVSTLASGQTRPYLQGGDIVLIPTVADLEGLNRITRTVLHNAAHAMIGILRGGPLARSRTEEKRPVVAATMFGVTTACVHHAREILESAGCEVIVFHATGVGGQAMESLIRDGQIDAVLDLTTTEIADELVGGVLSAGPDRLRAAGRAGIPQVVSLGALDMVNFGPRETVPERFERRRFHIHNPNVTLMRTTPEESAEIGRTIAERLNKAQGPVDLLIPLGGVSALDAPGRPFAWAEADDALIRSIEQALDTSHPLIRLIRVDSHINDPGFAEQAASHLLEMLKPERSPRRTD